MRRPINAPVNITTEFGVPDSYAFFGRHSGVDYGVAVGRAVYAPTAGKIVYAAYNATGGNMVILFDGQFYHRLMHNSVIHVVVNQQVTEGQHLADAGATGLATGPHVHWDIMDNIISSANPRPTAFSGFKDPSVWLAGGYVVSTPSQGDEMIANETEARNAYYLLRGDTPVTQAEITGTAGKRTWAAFAETAKPEVKNREIEKAQLKQAITDRDSIINQLRTELQNSSGTTKAEKDALLEKIATLTAQYTDEQRKYDEKVKELEAEKANKSEDTKLLDSFKDLFNKLVERFKK